MVKGSCSRCGAPGAGFICAYCGAALHEPGDEGSELAALDEYHKLIDSASGNVEQCSRLITQGYVPVGAKALIEAGMRCLPRMDASQSTDGCHEQWLARLEAISIRLRLTGGEQGAKAAAEFEAKTKAWHAKNASDFRHGCGFLSALMLALIYLAWHLYNRR